MKAKYNSVKLDEKGRIETEVVCNNPSGICKYPEDYDSFKYFYDRKEINPETGKEEDAIVRFRLFNLVDQEKEVLFNFPPPKKW